MTDILFMGFALITLAVAIIMGAITIWLLGATLVTASDGDLWGTVMTFVGFLATLGLTVTALGFIQVLIR